MVLQTFKSKGIFYMKMKVAVCLLVSKLTSLITLCKEKKISVGFPCSSNNTMIKMKEKCFRALSLNPKKDCWFSH